jgi:hypothetical protein
VFGRCFGSLSYLDQPREATLAGIGMVFRLMPHWQVAPFAGGGGGFDRLLSQSERVETSSEVRLESFWYAQAEAGVRFWFSARTQYMEATVSQWWPDSKSVNADTFIGLTYGQSF